MQNLYRISLYFLFAGACLGLFLRWQLVFPVKGVTYTYVLHGHSHVMFLGWICNVLLIGFHDRIMAIPKFKVLFYSLQILVLGMLISFPLQGYGLYSIAFSALHTFGVFAVAILFFRATVRQNSLAVWFARIALLFFVISAAGPFALGYLKANGMEHTNLYRFSIYFYLHFQYNGFFFFGVLALFTKLVEDKLAPRYLKSLRVSGILFAVSCIPAFLLSTLFSVPATIVYVTGFVAGAAQIIAVLLIIRPAMIARREVLGAFQPEVRRLFSLSFVILCAKFVLQWISALPWAAALAEAQRAIVIAYLHLVLVGVISLFLFGWLIHYKVIAGEYRPAIRLFLFGFAATELLLFISPGSRLAPSFLDGSIPVGMLVASVAMVLSIGMLCRLATSRTYRFSLNKQI